MLTTSYRYVSEVQVNQEFTGKYDSKNRLVTLSQTQTTKLSLHKDTNYTIKAALCC